MTSFSAVSVSEKRTTLVYASPASFAAATPLRRHGVAEPEHRESAGVREMQFPVAHVDGAHTRQWDAEPSLAAEAQLASLEVGRAGNILSAHPQSGPDLRAHA